MMDTQANTVNEPEVVCNHKPGDVWADGCCTSKKDNQTATEDMLNAGAPIDTNTDDQITDSK